MRRSVSTYTEANELELKLQLSKTYKTTKDIISSNLTA